MKTTRQFLPAIAISMLLSACSRTQTPESPQTVNQKTLTAAAPETKYSGLVTDAAGKPVPDATVEFWHYEGSFFQPGELAVEKRTISATNGTFELQVPAETGFLLVRKSGLAPAWKQLGQPFSPPPETENKFVLTPPGSLAGTVVDESNQPVANAEVFVAAVVSEIPSENGARSFNFLTGKPARDCFSTRTDKVGHFQITNFPTNANAFFAVHSPGQVLKQSADQFTDFETAGFPAGQSDIKLVVEPAGGIEGKIVGTEGNQPLPVARLTLQPDARNYFMLSGQEPVRSGTDGVFRFENVASGSYHIQAVFGTNAACEWVAELVPVSVEAGHVRRGVRVTAQRGALLEVSLIGEDDRKPVSHVSVSAYRENFQAGAISESNGVAQLRLLPGEYQIAAYRPSMPPAQTSATVEAGTTNRIEIDIASPRKISGIVREPDGKPAAGLPVRLVGGYGPVSSSNKTDADGRFTLEWNPQQIGGQDESTACVLVRDADHNLAAAQDIDEDTTNLDLKLAPALTLVGGAQADGKPVTNATAQLVFWTGRSGMWLQGLARITTPGQFEIPALPPGRRYGVIVSAPGYGQKQLYNLEISADAGRQELDTVELRPANLKLAGQVLDADNKPVAGCYVNLNGDGQPNDHVRTDRNGRFIFEHVCAGTLQVFANSQRSHGSISAEGGDTNVVLQLGQNYGSTPGATMHKLKGTVTDTDGQPVVGAQLAVFPNNGTRWFRTGTDGTYRLIWSLQSWQSGDALLVVRDAARNLAATEDLSEDMTNLDVKLEPALTLAGQVKGVGNSPLPGAEVGLWLKAGNSYNQLNDQMSPVNAEGRYEIKCLPVDAEYIVFAKAKGYGRSQQQFEPAPETNRMELEPFVLKLANRVIAGRVVRDDDKPASGVNVQLSGEDQPDGYMMTDSRGRFHFQVCEGQVRLFAYSQYGGGSAQATVEAGDTNIVMNLSSSQTGFREAPRRASLKGNPLPDLTSVNLAADAAPTDEPVLICLFNAGERPSRHVIHLLEEKAAALRQRNICVLGVQAAVISDEIFNEWKTDAPVSFPIGRVTVKSEKTSWAHDVAALPWLILTDANHRVIAEGFSLDELDAQIQKMLKTKG